jgi:hypothetical protein
MAIELDHVFICVAPGGAEAERLLAVGLREGTPNRHPGQGTACRRFFFRNAMLELLWVDDPQAAQSPTTRPTRLWERWSLRERVASPFGVGVRPHPSAGSGVPFRVWHYRPSYLPAHLAIEVAAGAPLGEPMWFCLGFAQRPDALTPEARQPLDHPIGLREVSAVRVAVPGLGARSDAAAILSSLGLVELGDGPEPRLEMGFDGERAGRRADFRPALPLVLRW